MQVNFGYIIIPFPGQAYFFALLFFARFCSWLIHFTNDITAKRIPINGKLLYAGLISSKNLKLFKFVSFVLIRGGIMT